MTASLISTDSLDGQLEEELSAQDLEDFINAEDEDVPTQDAGVWSDEEAEEADALARHGSLLRHATLKSLSSQLKTARSRLEKGQASCVAVSTEVMAVGTMGGWVLVFNQKQVLKIALQPPNTEVGGVSSVSLNNKTALLAGYLRGQISLFDWRRSEPLLTISNFHPDGVSVLGVHLLPGMRALVNDSGGSVFLLRFSTGFGRTSLSRADCVFSGSRGEALVTLPISPVVAVIATVSKMMVARWTSTPVFVDLMSGSAAFPPLLSWQSDEHVLCYARSHTVKFVRLDATLEVARPLPERTVDLDYNLIAVEWLSHNLLILIDTTELLHLYNFTLGQELAHLDLSPLRLVYSSASFKAAATGGQVSDAMAKAGEHACYSSLVRFGERLLLLGQDSVHNLAVRDWILKLRHLVAATKWEEAAQLASVLYKGNPQLYPGLPPNLTEARDALADVILQVLLSCPLHQLSHAVLADLVAIAFQACQLDPTRQHLLFSSVYNQAVNHKDAQGLFFDECLVQLEQGRLNFLPPTVANDLVDWLSERNLVTKLELCLLKIHFADLDLNKCTRLAWSLSLYGAAVHLYTVALSDLVTPLRRLLSLLHSPPAGVDVDQVFGVILDVVSYALRDESYPERLPLELSLDRKVELVQVLTARLGFNLPANCPTYPYLRVLLQYDMTGFLARITAAFSTARLTGEPSWVSCRQQVVGTLLELDRELHFPIPNVELFLADQLAVECPIQLLPMDWEKLLLGIFGDHPRKEDREEAARSLWRAKRLPWANDYLLERCEAAGFLKLSASLCRQLGLVTRELACCWRDESLLRDVWRLIPAAVETDRETVCEQLIENFELLLEIDAARAVELCQSLLDQDAALGSIKKPMLEVVFLRALLERGTLTGHTSLLRYLELLCISDPRAAASLISLLPEDMLRSALPITKEHDAYLASTTILQRTGELEAALLVTVNHFAASLKYLIEATKGEGAQDVNLATGWKKLAQEYDNLVLLSLTLKDQVTETVQSKCLMLLDAVVYLEHVMRKASETELAHEIKMFGELLIPHLCQLLGVSPVLDHILLKEKADLGLDVRHMIRAVLQINAFDCALVEGYQQVISTELRDKLYAARQLSGEGCRVVIPRCCFCGRGWSRGGGEDLELLPCGHAFHTECAAAQESCPVCVNLE